MAKIREGLRRDGRLKVQLFDHHDDVINARVLADFREHLGRLNCELVRSVTYTPTLQIHQVAASDTSVEQVLNHPGVRRAAPIPHFYALRHASVPVSDPGSPSLPVPAPDQDYPIVGLIDSGVADGCGPLQGWIHARETFVAMDEQNREHGTFVAGLVVLGSDVNPAGMVDSGGPCHILDVIVIPNDDGARGPVGTLTEDQLVAVLRDVVPRYRDRVKVWNLSLGSEEICHDGAFTDFGQVLDALQYENAVQFVVAAGNLNTLPLRTWPPQPLMGERDRICAPADSVVSVTVGALANARNVSSLVDVDEPAPFSRRGPGPAYIVKPEVVQYGGNCDATFGCLTTGVRSLDEAARVAEDIGTSFATPLVAGTLANVLASLDPPPSLNLAKALDPCLSLSP
ncbi:MAG: S8 family peptidase [Acidimicrobiia bacterium]